MKKTAFSLIELIFVIVLIGVLSGIAFYMNRPDATRGDAQYALLKLKEARYRAIGYQSSTASGVDGACVTLSKDALSNDVEPAHKVKSEITITSVMTYDSPAAHSLNGNEICFDGLGRPHEGNSVALNTLLNSDLNVTFTNTTYNTTIRIFPQSGYSAISCKN
jgi:prepilin-type N-terminal cleavage/methylation domain-containing protein